MAVFETRIHEEEKKEEESRGRSPSGGEGWAAFSFLSVGLSADEMVR